MHTVMAPGQKVDEFEIVGTLGQGAFSHTYIAVSPIGEKVLLKFPDPALVGDIAVYERFKREFAIGQKLRHPSVSRMIALREGREGPYLVCDYVEGVSLREYLRKGAPLPVEKAVDLGAQLAAALAYIHAQGVCHRDLKPENLVVSPEGTIHIVDFGIALSEGARRLTWRMLTNTMGTPDYMAPEQIQGKRGDARTDIYALGIILYEMLTGRVPFEGDNALSVMNQHLSTEPTLLRKLNSKVPATLQAVVLKAIRRDPGERYQDADSLLLDLRHLDQVDVAAFDLKPQKSMLSPHSTRTILVTGGLIALGFLVLVATIILVTMVLRR